MDTVITIDVETSKKPVLHPWQNDSYLTSVGVLVHGRDHPAEGTYMEYLLEHSEQQPGADQASIVNSIQHFITQNLAGSTLIVGHNLKFDLNWLLSRKVYMGRDTRLWDTQIAEHMLNGQEKKPKGYYSLDECCRRRGLPVKHDKVKTFWEAGVNTAEIPTHILLPYMKQDIVITSKLFKAQYGEAQKFGKNFLRLLRLRCDTLFPVCEMELNGMPFSRATAARWIKKFTHELEVITSELLTYFGRDDLNLNSGHELSAALFGGKITRSRTVPVVYTKKIIYKEPFKYTYKSGKNKGLTVTKTRNKKLDGLVCKEVRQDYDIQLRGVGFKPTEDIATAVEGVYQTNKDVLKSLPCGKGGGTTQQFKRDVIKKLIYRSKIEKFISTFEGKKADSGIYYTATRNRDGFLHPQYNQTITATGRFSSSGDMNGQNTARAGEDDDGFTNPMKTCFVSRYEGGQIVVVDLAQLEWRIAAWLSQDPVAMDEIRRGVDQHLENAIEIFGDAKYRQTAKIMTFRLLYGGSAYAFYKDPAFPNFSMRKWNQIVDTYNGKYVVLSQWQQENIVAVGENDGVLVSPTGRRYHIPQVPHKKYAGVMVYSETCIKNYPVQGTATGDVVPLAIYVMWRRMQADPDFYKDVLLISQVHDSLIFDAPPGKAERVSKDCIQVFEDLPHIIEQYWGLPMNVPLTGDSKWGSTYGDMEYKLTHDMETDQWECKKI